MEMEPKKAWIVFSSKGNTSKSYLEPYSVTYEKECSCEICCNDCNVCIHKFSCTCHDYSIRFVICKHIYFVVQHFNCHDLNKRPGSFTNSNDDLTIDIDEDINRNEEHAAISELKKNVISDLDQ
ncbi:hypothetical protein X975_12047, partial [Stegodyphus mimosarum]